MKLDAKIPSGDISEKWTRHKFEMKLVSPANRRKHQIIIVGTGLAGASAAATLGEAGYQVKSIFYHESPRRAHSIAAQGGINAAKNYQNDGDSVFRLFYDTIKGGDFRAREANVHRLAEVSTSIIDQCVAQGVPFAREYGGTLANRSFGGTQVSRTFYARGQTGQQLLLGAYGAMMRQVDAGQVEMLTRREFMDLVVVNGQARGVIVRNLLTGELETHMGSAVVLATGGYSNVYYLSTNAKHSNVSATWRAYKKGALFANPSFMQIHPTCIPVSGDYQSKLTLMSESLRNDGRVWVPKQAGDKRSPTQIPESERDYFLERKYPSFGNLVPRDVASRNAKTVCDEGRGVGNSGEAVYLDFADAIGRLGPQKIAEKYGNLFEIYSNITGEDPYKLPMRIFPAPHYTMGGLWVDYHLMTTIPGLFAIGEANFSDHGANRLGASALMQGLADGYFVLPYTLANYLGNTSLASVSDQADEAKATRRSVAEKIDRILGVKGKTPVTVIHRRLGRVMWNFVGMSRSKEGCQKAIQEIRELREEFWSDCAVPGDANTLNHSIELAGRVADFLEFGELIAKDAETREESCGCHFREEYQTPENEALRNDDAFAHVAAFEYQGEDKEALRHQEALVFENVKPSQRSYK
ncbi:MAG: fumarate reductase/succinate dehydrogenase flavoprotein subunit [Bradymonadales bacterium]|nr:MAG: fumarate reductase/succinate dehydrogenase flavoprotein subunit [Bradymonadales bacterium]